MSVKYIVNEHVREVFKLEYSLNIGGFADSHSINMVMKTTFKSNKLREGVLQCLK